MNGMATHQWTIVYDASHRTYVEDKLFKINILTPYLETSNDIATKCGETHVRDSKFSRWSAPDIYLLIIHNFSYRGLPIGATVSCYTLESSRGAGFNATTCRFRDIYVFRGPKFWIFGTPREYRPKKGEATSGTDMYHHAKFHGDQHHRRWYSCPTTKNRLTTDDIGLSDKSDKNDWLKRL